MTNPVQPSVVPDTPTTGAEALVFSCKAAVSAVVALVGFNLFHIPGAIWAPVSAVIVTQPRLHPSYKASLLRVAANLIGAFAGAVAGLLVSDSIIALALGVVATGLICHYARMDDAIRPAFAAVVIVTLSSEPHVWRGSLDRVVGVMSGCAAALIVGFVFDLVSRLFSARTTMSSHSQNLSE